MTEPVPIIIPLINPNEPGALLASLNFSTGQKVKKGDNLCTLETTKSTVEMTAERDGYDYHFLSKESKLVSSDI